VVAALGIILTKGRNARLIKGLIPKLVEGVDTSAIYK
jgi:hypothetical protein